MLAPRVAALLVALVCLVTACGSPPPDPPSLLSEAKTAVDNSATVHFDISSDGSAQKAKGAFVVSGNGSAKRPDQFTGSIQASLNGVLIPVKVLSAQGGFWILKPFTAAWERTTPATYGFSDPASMLNKDHGLTSLLVNPRDLHALDNDRLNGQELYEVRCKVDGQKVALLLTSADPTVDDEATFGIDVKTHELRRIVVTGPFFVKGLTSTYTVILSDYNADVTVTPPA